MALGYLRQLYKNASNQGGSTSSDVNYQQTRDFHREAFERSGLGIDNWTLNTPMELIRQQLGDAAVEKLWQEVRDTGGDGLDALLQSMRLAAAVGRAALSTDPAIRQLAQDWMDRVPGVANFEQMMRAIEAFRKAFSKPLDTPLGTWEAEGWTFAEGWDFIDPAANDNFRQATNPPRRDPLAIDLDGDGIETVGIVAGGTLPILFDHNADGIRTGTGWLRADDAWLVLDRDGNGSIDSGRELFGVDTLITVSERVGTTASGEPVINTVTRTAHDGFEALRSLDTGNGTAGSAGFGDGVFNASDAGFSQVRLWQDANQDGLSQAGELRSLAALGLASIEPAYTLHHHIRHQITSVHQCDQLRAAHLH